MAQNLPFVITMMLALLLSTYMLFDPADWLYDLMGFTDMSPRFEVFLLVLAVGGFALSYICELYVFVGLAKGIGKLKDRVLPSLRKVRKQYKVIGEEMSKF